MRAEETRTMRRNVATWVVAIVITWQGPLRASQEASDGPPPPPLALHRLELRPDTGWAFVPSSLTRAFVGADVTFRAFSRWAFGVDAAWYSPFDSALPASPKYPLDETSWSASFDAAFFPWVVRAPEGRETGAFEAFVLLGAGLVATRPVSIVDPTNRHFDSDNNLVQWSAGLGAHIYLTRSLALTIEVRDLVYLEKVENAQAAAGQTPLPIHDPNNPANSATWYSPSTRLSQCLELRLGASLFLP
jgi:hypothetical protein